MLKRSYHYFFPHFSVSVHLHEKRPVQMHRLKRAGRPNYRWSRNTYYGEFHSPACLSTATFYEHLWMCMGSALARLISSLSTLFLYYLVHSYNFTIETPNSSSSVFGWLRHLSRWVCFVWYYWRCTTLKKSTTAKFNCCTPPLLSWQIRGSLQTYLGYLGICLTLLALCLHSARTA